MFSVSHIKEGLAWLVRWRGSQGFGVQSPTAYRFIRHVVCEQAPYYAYDGLSRRFPELTGWRLRLCRFYLRLSNHAQADEWVVYGRPSDAFGAYVKAGCHRTSLCQTPSVSNGKRVFVMGLMAGWQPFFDEVLRLADETTLLVVEGIHDNRRACRCWRQMAKDSRTGVTFDLYHCGIVFFDRRPKMHYKANLA